MSLKSGQQPDCTIYAPKMASKIVPIDFCEDLLRCVICYEPFSEKRIPKALPCLHSFCADCLQSSLDIHQKSCSAGLLIASRHHDYSIFPCPVCKELCEIPPNGLAGFRDDFRIRQISEAISRTLEMQSRMCGAGSAPSSPTGRKCHVCRLFNTDSEAPLECIECSRALCQSCADKHVKTTVGRTHTIVEMNNVTPDSLNCSLHRAELLKFYCQDCSHLLCFACTFTNEHNGHNIVHTANKCREVKDDLRSLLALCKEQTLQIKEHFAQLTHQEVTLRRKEKEVRKAILSRSTNGSLESKFSRGQMESDLQSTCSEKQDLIQDIRQKLHHELLGRQEVISYIETQLNSKEIMCLLVIHTDVKSKLDAMRTFTSPYYEFEMDITNLGRFELWAWEWGADISMEKRMLYKPVPSGPPSRQSGPPSRQSGPSSRLSVSGPSSRLSHHDRMLSASQQNLAVRRLVRFGRKGSANGEFNFPSGVAFLPSGDVAVADLHNNRVQVFDVQGRFKYKFCKEGMKPCGIAMTLDGHIAVTDCRQHVNCIRIFTVDGVCSRTVGSGQFEYPFSLAINSKGRFVVSDPALNEIIILNENGSLFSRFSTHSKFAFYLAVNKNDEILVSDWFNHCVKIFDSCGHLLSKIGSEGYGNGQSLIPLGICTDSQDNVLILDCKCERVSMFTQEGKFLRCLVEKTESMYHARAIALSREGHIVITYGDNKQDVPSEIAIYQTIVDL